MVIADGRTEIINKDISKTGTLTDAYNRNLHLSRNYKSSNRIELPKAIVNGGAL